MQPRSSTTFLTRWWPVTGLTAGLALVGLLAACGGGTNGVRVCSTSGQGSLTVSIAAPGGITPEVLVTGPGGYQQTLSATQTLTNVSAGSYLVETLRVTQPPSGGALVGMAYGANGDPVVSACVTAAQTTTVARAYAQQSGSARLWAANEIGGAVVGYSAADLAAGGTHAAAAVIDLTGSTLNTTYGFQLAFGPSGALWVSDPVGGGSASGQLLVFWQGQLASSGSPVPDLTIEAAAFDDPGQLAFDGAGNLYLLDRGANQILEYTAGQVRQLLQGGGTVSTAPAYSYRGTVLVDPRAMAFDHLGNLWVVVDDSAVATGDVQLVRYDAASLGSGGTITPGYRIRGTTSSEIIGYEGLAFDASGNLWVVGTGTYRYAATDLAGSGTTTTVTPAYSTATIGGSPQADTDAIDAAGNVWVTGNSQDLDRYYAAGPTAQSGWLTSADLDYPMGLALYPSPLSGTVPLR